MKLLVRRTNRLGKRIHRRKKQTRSVQSHLPVSLTNWISARTRPPMSAGEMVFSSTKITPPCFRPSSAHVLSSGGMVLRSKVTSVNRSVAASSKQAESSWPRKLPFSHSAIQCTTSERLRRLRPSATSGEICSSRRSLSISASRWFGGFGGDEFRRLGQHVFQRLKIRCIVFRRGLLYLFRKNLGIVNGRPNLGFWPSQMLGNSRYTPLVAPDEQHDLPNCERTALNVGLSACRRIAKVDETQILIASSPPRLDAHLRRSGSIRVDLPCALDACRFPRAGAC